MRCIFVGVEYAGKSTLINRLTEYYHARKQRVHGDDHFTIPDATLSPESRRAMLDYPNDVKERSQRMQLQYHVAVLRNYPHVMIAGWHIEEAIYSAVYGNDPDSPYYPNYGYGFHRGYEAMVFADRLPDVFLIHVTASDEAIRQRMSTEPHEYQIIREKDIADLKQRFEEEVEESLFSRGGRIDLDTTDKTPEESLDELLLKTDSLVTAGEMAIRALPIPDSEYEVRYEGGVRRMVPTGK